MNSDKDSLVLKCDGQVIYPQIDQNEKTAMLVTGGSRMGKTYFLSFLASELIRKGYTVGLIDLGDKWSEKDKTRLKRAGATVQNVESEGIVLSFGFVGELIDSTRHIANALGFQSVYAQGVIKTALKAACKIKGNNFSFSDFMRILQNLGDENQEEKEWGMKILERLESYDSIPKIIFEVGEDSIFPKNSTIWDFADLNETYVHILAHLILWCSYCQKRQKFKSQRTMASKLFLIIDEFQTLDCNRRSVMGVCLTEGQKYGLSLILATQFLTGNFSDAVIQQFKQGGFRFYFRLTEEEAAVVSKQLLYNFHSRRQLQDKLTKLPVGNCLMIGPHTVGERKELSENIRFLKVECTEESKCINNNPKVVINIPPENNGKIKLPQWKRSNVIQQLPPPIQ